MGGFGFVGFLGLLLAIWLFGLRCVRMHDTLVCAVGVGPSWECALHQKQCEDSIVWTAFISCRLLLALVSFICTKCGLHLRIKELGWLRVGGFSLKMRKVRGLTCCFLLL